MSVHIGFTERKSKGCVTAYVAYVRVLTDIIKENMYKKIACSKKTESKTTTNELRNCEKIITCIFCIVVVHCYFPSLLLQSI